MKSVVETFFKFIHNNITVIDIIAGALVFIITLIMKNALSKKVLSLISKLFKKENSEKRKGFIESLNKPLSALFAVSGLFFALYINIESVAILKAYKISVILIICWGAVNYLSDNLFSLLHYENESESGLNKTAVKFLSNIFKIIIIAFGIVMVISELGYNINGLITGIGISGLAVSLAAQDAVSNLISGFIIVLEKPFGVGEFISVNDISGTVEEVTMRSTVIRTLDDSLVTMPNSSLTNAAIINISRMEKRLLDIEYALTYSSSNELLEKCRADIKEYLKDNENILPYPIRAEYEKLDDYSINLNVFCYTPITDIHKYKEFLSSVNLDVKKIIEDNGAEFAFPTSSIYIEK